jgi:hypothetical protein
MPEVIRRRPEGLDERERFQVRTSKPLAAAIRSAAARDGATNPTTWCRDQLAKAAGYEAPAEAAAPIPWEVSEGGEPEPNAPPIEVNETPTPAPKVSRAKAKTRKKKGKRVDRSTQVGPSSSPPRMPTPAPSLVDLATIALRRIFR